jgi:tRNA pseudouridine32 synthase/23S rRNA pseudouridine746 synthase
MGPSREFPYIDRVEQNSNGERSRLRLVHEDGACVVVDKAVGQLSVPGRGVLAEGSVAERVQACWPDAKVVHRLDMATSGLLLFARGLDHQRAFSRMFAQRAVAKSYAAVVRGQLGSAPGDRGEIALPLAADWPNRPRQKVDVLNGKPCLTHWQVLAHGLAAGWTRLALNPVTGRSHQLRVHLLAIGHPILGDALYCPDQATAEAPRLMLHAESLAFVHPVHGTTLALHAPAPF